MGVAGVREGGAGRGVGVRGNDGFIGAGQAAGDAADRMTGEETLLSTRFRAAAFPGALMAGKVRVAIECFWKPSEQV